jgi:hypothetical protein
MLEDVHLLLAPLLLLGLDPDHWLDAVQDFGRRCGIRLARGACKARDFTSGVA